MKRWAPGNSQLRTRQPSEANLPFSFGVEFELQVRVKNVDEMGNYPGAEASVAVMRRYNFNLLEKIASVLSENGMDAVRHDLSSDDSMDSTKWNVVLDGSLSKAHMADGYCKFLPQH